MNASLFSLHVGEVEGLLTVLHIKIVVLGRLNRADRTLEVVKFSNHPYTGAALMVPTISNLWPVDEPDRQRKRTVTEKLDPRLLELVESADSSSGDRSASVDVLVAVAIELDEAIRDDLTSRGLALRSEVGTVLTGSIMIADVHRLAESANVVKLEASTPLYLETIDEVVEEHE